MTEVRFAVRATRGKIVRAWGGILVLAIVVGACASNSPYEGLGADAIHDSAMAAHEAGDWDRAIEGFELFTAEHAGDPRVGEVRFHLAEARFRNEDYLSAANEFDLYLVRHSDQGRVAEASLGICRSYAALAPHPQRDPEYTEQARDACTVTRNQFPGTNAAEEAEALRVEMVELLAEGVYQEADFYQRRGLHDSAILVLERLVEAYPETSWAPAGYLALYNSFREIGWDDEASEARDQLISLYPESAEAEELRAEDDGGDGGPNRALR